MHGKRITTGWHCDAKIGKRKQQCDIFASVNLRVRVKDEVSNISFNSFFFLQVDAEQYYSELEEKRTDEFNAEKNRITMKRLGIAFVTFRDERMTAV